MASTALQQEILDILKVKMPEADQIADQIADLKETIGGNKIKSGCEVLKRSNEEEYRNRPVKKLKSSDPKDHIDDDEVEFLNSTIELGNDDHDDASTDSDDISDDDEIEFIKEVSDVLPASLISAELLNVVNSISKEVVEQVGNLDQSGDTGFGSDDNVEEKVSKSESVVGGDETANNTDDDIDCLLLSSPLKPVPEMVLNPLFHMGSSTTSEDSNSSSDVKSLSSVESLTLKVSSSEESNSSSSSNLKSSDDDSKDANDGVHPVEKEDVPNSISEAHFMQVKEDKVDRTDASENKPSNKESSTETSISSNSNSSDDSSNTSGGSSGHSGSEIIGDDDDIMVVEVKSSKFKIDEKPPQSKPLDSYGRSGNSDGSKTSDDSKTEHKVDKDAKIIMHTTAENVSERSSANTDSDAYKVNTEEVKDQNKREEGENEVGKPIREGGESSDSIVLVELDNDETPDVKKDKKPTPHLKPLCVSDDSKPKPKDDKDAKDSIIKHLTSEDITDRSSPPTETAKSEVKSEEVKEEIKKEEIKKEDSKIEVSKTNIKDIESRCSNSIILVELDDDDETPEVKTDVKPTDEAKIDVKKTDVTKPSIDLTKIKKCYVHCEKAAIPPGLPIPTLKECIQSKECFNQEGADDEIELLDPYPVQAGPCSVCHQTPDRVSFFPIGNGLDEATAVRDERISVISWEISLQSDWPPCFKATNLSVYDSMGHMVPYDGGLIEAGQSLFFSGLLMNIVDDSETLAVDKIGPLTGWRRPDGEHRSTSLILSTCLEGTDVEYHIDTADFSKTYKAALKKDQLYKSFSRVLSKVPNSNLNKPTTDLKPKVQSKSQSFESDLKQVFSGLANKTSIKITPVPARTARSLKRKSSGSEEFEPSGTSTDDDWSPERNRPARKVTKRAASPEESDDDVSGGSNPYFNQIKKKVPAVLKSLNSSPGNGKGLVKLLPGHSDSVDAVTAFLRFIHERQTIWVNKSKGIMPMTKNKVMSSKWFTNMYRELDRGTTFFRKCIIDTVLKDVKIDKSVIKETLVVKVVFRSIVYRLINKVETFTDYGGLPDLDDFPKFLNFLAKKKASGVVIFTAAHQNMGYDRLMRTFDYVKKNVKNLASEIVAASKKKTIKKCQEVLLKIPNVGAFFAWQILCDLLECRILGSCTDNQWACLGPGAKNGLRRLFPLATTKGELKYTRLLRDLCAPSGSGSGFAALGLKFPAFLHKPLSLKNVEHALCEYDKYFRSALGVQIKEREYSEQKSRSGLDNKARCGECDKQSDASSRVMCALCSSSFHKKCKRNWERSFHADGTWLCNECHKSEQAWGEEEFQYEELDKNDEVEKAFFSGAAKKEARLKRKGKKEKKKVKEIECIDLSSDEEEEDDIDDEVDEGSDEEVEYLEEIKGHFFGVDYDETINEGDQDNTISVEQDEEDPFAGVGVWFTEDSESSKEEEVNGLEDEDVLILS